MQKQQWAGNCCCLWDKEQASDVQSPLSQFFHRASCAMPGFLLLWAWTGHCIIVPGKSELLLPRVYTQQKPNPVELWLRSTTQQNQPWKEKNKTKGKSVKNHTWNLLMKDTGGKSNWGKEIRIAKTRCKKKEQAAGLSDSSSSSRTDGSQWNIRVSPVSALGNWLLLQSSALSAVQENS